MKSRWQNNIENIQEVHKNSIYKRIISKRIGGHIQVYNSKDIESKDTLTI